MARGVRPDTFEYRWVAAVVQATAQRAGVPSRWNGRLFVEPEHAGSAMEDGGLAVSQEILDLAGRAYQGEQLDDQELDTLRAGVTTVVHESKHLTSWPGDLAAPDAAELYAPDVVSLEEGLAEDFAQRNADDVIRDIGMDQVAPGLVGREQDDTSPAYTAGTDQLVDGLAQLGRVEPDYIRHNLSATGRAQRWAATAEFLIDQRLSDLMPEEHRTAVRDRLVAAMRTQFTPLKAVHDSDRGDVAKAIAGHQLGQGTVGAVRDVLNHTETHYRDWHQQQALSQAQPQQGEVQHLRQFLDAQRPGRGGEQVAEATGTGRHQRQVGSRRDQGLAAE